MTFRAQREGGHHARAYMPSRASAFDLLHPAAARASRNRPPRQPRPAQRGPQRARPRRHDAVTAHDVPASGGNAGDDGDGEIFNRFTTSVDVIGHELTHGVTGSEVNLTYLRQSGALNESVSDVFGSMVKQYVLKQTASEADWLIGAGLLANFPDQALRSMKAPGKAYDNNLMGKDPQPADMVHYVDTAADNGGVHTNS